MEERSLPVFEEVTAEVPQKPKRRPGAAYIILVQSVCCAVLVVLFWLFRLVGGEGYTRLRTAFQGALENNALFATVATLFEQTEPDETYTQTQTTTSVTTAMTTTTTTTSATNG